MNIFQPRTYELIAKLLSPFFFVSLVIFILFSSSSMPATIVRKNSENDSNIHKIISNESFTMSSMKSYFMDTNYFLRFLLKDNDQQFQVVKKLFEKALQGKALLFTSLIVFFELNWVLSSSYNQNREKIIEVLTNILSLSFLDIENREKLERSFEIFKNSSLELEDCYHLAYFYDELQDGGFTFGEFLTFDKKLQKYLAKNA